MKKFFGIMVLSVLLIGSMFSENWKKIDTKVLSDFYIKEFLTVSPWIENQIVKETFIDVDSIEYKNAVAKSAGYSSYKEYQEELAYYNIMATANIVSNIGTLVESSLK